MSQENVELVLAARDAYNAGHFDAFIELCAPDIEAFPDASVFPESSPIHGRHEYRRFLEEIDTAWMRGRNETVETYAVGPDRVLHRGQWGGEGAASGLYTTASLTDIWTIRDGQIARVEYFFDHDQALKAVGLEE
jgi:ketosteroid isomerase-like protein